MLNFSASAAAPMLPREKVIIDTDIGDDIDDAFALAWALSNPKLEVLAVITSWGDTALRVRLVRRLLAVLDRRDVIVAAGPATRSLVPFTQARWAQGGQARPPAPAPDAVEVLRGLVRKHPGEITLVGLAPMSTIGALYDRDPAALAKLKRIAFMGGSIDIGYDFAKTPSAEYNVASDVPSARKLFAAPVPLVMFPLDSTQVKLEEGRRESLFAHGAPLTDALALLYHQWRVLNPWKQVTPTLFDAIPIAWLVDPSFCPVQELRLTVDGQGYTRREAGPPNLQACLSVRGDAVVEKMLSDLER